jgi:hypothetical protein
MSHNSGGVTNLKEKIVSNVKNFLQMMMKVVWVVRTTPFA